MVKKALLIGLTTLANSMSLAATIPLQPVFSDDLIVIPYTNAVGETRAEFRYRLDPVVSGFNSYDLSGWVTLDAPQLVQAGDFANEFYMDFNSLDSTEFSMQAFSYDFTPQDGISLYASGDALMTGQAEFHRGEFPNEFVTGNLGFLPGGAFNNVAGVPFICIECGLDVYLNFLYMDYSTGSLQLNLDDSRAALFFGQDYFDGFSPYGWSMNMSVVPLPAGWLLISSALIALGFARKRP